MSISSVEERRFNRRLERRLYYQFHQVKELQSISCNIMYIHYFQAALHAHITSIIARLQHKVLVISGEREQLSVLCFIGC